MCVQETTYLCALNFTWKILRVLPEAQPQTDTTPTSSLWRSCPQALGTLQIELSLQRGVSDRVRDGHQAHCTRLHDRHLRDSAYRPRIFVVMIEKRNFRPASRLDTPEEKSPAGRLRYGLRIVFDQLPFPAYEDWVTDFGDWVQAPPVGPADRTQTPMREFVARSLPKAETRGGGDE